MRAQGNALGSIFYTPGNFFNPTLIGEAITGIPAGRKLSQFVKSPGADGNPDPYGFTKGVRVPHSAPAGHPPVCMAALARQGCRVAACPRWGIMLQPLMGCC